MTIEEARANYFSGSMELKNQALKEYPKAELNNFPFTKIKSFEDAMDALKYDETLKDRVREAVIHTRVYSKASAAMFQLNIIRQALNQDYDLHLNDRLFFPSFKINCKNEIFSDSDMEEYGYIKVGKFEYNNKIYTLFTKDVTTNNFLGCATKEIAKHFGIYFGTLIMEAAYTDIFNLKIISND